MSSRSRHSRRALPTQVNVGVRVRRLEWSPDHSHPLALEDGVEGTAELRVAVVDEEARPLTSIVQIDQLRN
jgi:hypothetical protein